jgi:exosortase
VKYNVLRMTGSTQAEPYPPKLATNREERGPIGSNDTTGPRSYGWLPYAILGALLVVIYFRIAGKLVYDWSTIPDYSHGFLVPLFAGYLIWDKRQTLSATPVKQTWSGIFLIVFAIILLILGFYGVELFTTRMSFIFLMAGLVWTFFGGKMLRELRFPLLVLILAIPIPAIIFNHITFPLQLRASQIASDILRMLGVPVLQDGNVIQLPVMKLEVAEACSGIRSLMSLFALAVFYGYFLERTTKRRVILALSSLPIAVAANVVRIVGTGLCVQYWDPDKALGFFHEFSGLVMFVASLGCLYLVHKLMNLISPTATGVKA